MDPIERLPAEVFAQVLGSLASGGRDAPRDVLRASLVSRAWFAAVMADASLWRSVCLTQGPPAHEQVGPMEYAIGELGMSADRWSDALHRSRPSDEAEDEDDEGDMSTTTMVMMKVMKVMRTEWYHAFVFMMSSYLCWDPDAMTHGLVIDRTDPRSLLHSNPKMGYLWARTRNGFSSGVHRWRVTMTSYSFGAAVGVFPKEFNDWTPSWDWQFGSGYFYQPFCSVYYDGRGLAKPAAGGWVGVGFPAELVVDVTLDMTERTLRFGAKLSTDPSRAEAVTIIALRHSATELCPAAVASSFHDRFIISPPWACS